MSNNAVISAFTPGQQMSSPVVRPKSNSPILTSKWDPPPLPRPRRQGLPIKAALVDCYCLSRDCIIGATRALGNDISFVPFSTIRDCVTYQDDDLDVILYYSHEDNPLERLPSQEITTLRQAFSHLPVIVLSDAKQSSQPKIVRDILRLGARGFIPTQSIEMQVVSAAIRYVAEGGTVIPVEILLSDEIGYAEPQNIEPLPTGLTSRQMIVLTHLRQGKPNKIIAHDLRMSESTVKVHIRNIMRKMGATNRTQAVYKARQYCDNDMSMQPAAG